MDVSGQTLVSSVSLRKGIQHTAYGPDQDQEGWFECIQGGTDHAATHVVGQKVVDLVDVVVSMERRRGRNQSSSSARTLLEPELIGNSVTVRPCSTGSSLSLSSNYTAPLLLRLILGRQATDDMMMGPLQICPSSSFLSLPLVNL